MYGCLFKYSGQTKLLIYNREMKARFFFFFLKHADWALKMFHTRSFSQFLKRKSFFFFFYCIEKIVTISIKQQKDKTPSAITDVLTLAALQLIKTFQKHQSFLGPTQWSQTAADLAQFYLLQVLFISFKYQSWKCVLVQWFNSEIFF